MTGYLYVVSAPAIQQLKPSKVGITRDLRTRFSRLRSDASSPYRWQPWRAYRTESFEDARKLESMIKKDSDLEQFRMPGKTEHFDCMPHLIGSRLTSIAAAEKIDLLPNFPFHASEMAGRGFPSMPKEILDSLPKEAQLAYWQGVKDALFIFAHFDGIPVDTRDMWALNWLLDINIESNEPPLWSTVVGHYRNHSASDRKSAAELALKTLGDYERIAWEDWKEE